MTSAATSTQVVTRFAPSPTGYLHVGGARTALFNWLIARHTGGKFLLRIEDTDQARSTQKAVDALLEDLAWLGLNHDNEKLLFQSRRLEVYNSIIDDLMRRGLAYKAYETTEELDAMRKQAEREKRAFIYRRPTGLSDEQVRRYESEKRPHVVRFAMPVKDYSFHDVVLDNDVSVPSSQVQDFVIRKSDGMPTYHFAVVVDDAESGITHVLRGQEHLLNTINHIALMEALAYPRPTFGHLPVILNVDGSKMGKRDRDKKVRSATLAWMRNIQKTVADLSAACGVAAQRLSNWLADGTSQLDPSEHALLMPIVGLRKGDLPEILVHDFRENGYLPEVLLNFLALLGWSPGNDRERMSIDEMVRLFALKDIGRANAKFNREKLLAFNTEACAAASDERLLAAMKDYLLVNPDSPLNAASPDQLLKLLHMRRGFRTLRDVDEPCRFFFVPDDQITYDAQAVEKVLRKNNGEGLNVLRDVRDLFATVNDWRHAPLETAIKQYCEQKGLGLGKVAQPIRVAISGTTVSPPIFESIEFLGKERTLARIDRCLV
jgi:glutamyl-tRNA synthetase